MRRHLSDIPIWVVFAVALFVYGLTAGSRVLGQSPSPHFVLQAASWIEGRLDVPRWPDTAEDRARVDEIRLDGGSLVRGRWVRSRQHFRTTRGETIDRDRIHERVGTTYFVSFPPFPSFVFLPLVAIDGEGANDVLPTIVLAALAPALMLLFLRRLRRAGLSARTPEEELWLVVLFGFGSVFFFSAVQGTVWYTAHVIAVDLCILYALTSVGASRPLLSGTLLGLAFLTRAPMLFMFPFFIFEAKRAHRERIWSRLVLFAAPVVVLALLAAVYNLARFDELTEFGHRYLEARQQVQIEEFGLFSLRYLPRNLAAALTLVPTISSDAPFVSISGHGLAIWITTPALVWLIISRSRGTTARGLWITVALVAPWTLLYQNTGWFQFGYRFSLDVMVFLVALMALTERPMSRTFRALVIVGVVVNLFGAVTFQRFNQFYRPDIDWMTVAPPEPTESVPH